MTETATRVTHSRAKPLQAIFEHSLQISVWNMGKIMCCGHLGWLAEDLIIHGKDSCLKVSGKLRHIESAQTNQSIRISKEFWSKISGTRDPLQSINLAVSQMVTTSDHRNKNF